MRLKLFFLMLSFFYIIFNPIPIEDGNYDLVFEKKDAFLLAIPSLDIYEDVCSVGREYCLSYGVWAKHFDLEKSNFLLTGHNFFVYPFKSGVFYNLDEIAIGDDIYILFNQKGYLYRVQLVEIIESGEVSVENFDMEENILRIYTCYPKWSNFKRFFIQARRLSI